jgi:drug/metabolite transporter (DMT)-like permease
MLLEKKAVADVNSIVIVAYVVTFTCLSFVIWTGVQGGFTAGMLRIPFPAWGGIFAIAVFTTLMGTIALSVGIKYVGSAKAAIISVFEPVEAILLGVLLFQERLTVRGWIGIFLVIGAILLVNLQKAKNE